MVLARTDLVQLVAYAHRVYEHRLAAAKYSVRTDEYLHDRAADVRLELGKPARERVEALTIRDVINCNGESVSGIRRTHVRARTEEYALRATVIRARDRPETLLACGVLARRA